MKVTVKFIFPLSFPEGGGGTAMLLQTAKGLVSAGVDVEVLIPRSTEREGTTLNTQLSGVYHGVGFRYLTGSLLRPKTLFGRYLNFLNGFSRLHSYLGLLKKTDPKSVIVVKGPLDGITLLLYAITAKLRGLKSFYNFDDYPDYLLFPGKFAPLQKMLTEKLAFGLFDGFIVISSALKNYTIEITGKPKQVYLLPMTVDPSRFEQIPEDIVTPDEYILYTGFDFNPGPVFSSKDGLLDLISVFAEVARDRPKLKLVIIGENNALYHEHTKQLGIVQKVVFLGRRGRQEIIVYQRNAKILVLPRPWSKQAEGGFSSKLGEYLLTGKPVLMTDVGDPALYLNHGVNAVFAVPGDTKDLAAKLKWILANDNEAFKIGGAGREVALTRFNHHIEGKKLASWLHGQLSAEDCSPITLE